MPDYLASIDSPVPQHVNPADHAIELVNTEFLKHDSDTYGSAPTVSADKHLNALASKWSEHAHATPDRSSSHSADGHPVPHAASTRSNAFAAGAQKTLTLMHRTALNYSRNLLAYGIRCGWLFAQFFESRELMLTLS